MNSQDSDAYANHDDIWLLLPWYANGSLKAGERERVTAHLRVCLLCRKEMAEQAMLAKRLRHEPAVEISPKPSFDRLMARIQSGQAAPAGRPKAAGRPRRWAAWIDGLLAAWTPPRLAAVGASLALAFALAFLPVWQRQPTAAFHTVADSGSLDRFAPNDLRVIFAEQATEQEQARLVTAIQGQIVDGPGPGGIYTVRLAADAGGLPHALARLRGNPAVVFAEPALPQPGQPGGGDGR